MSNELISINEFQTAVPSNDGVLTLRSTNTASPSNNDLLNTYNLEVSTIPSNVVHEVLPPNADLIVGYETVVEAPVLFYSQGTCFENMDSAALITSKNELFIYLCDVLIRFDASPSNYQKEDYAALITMLTGSLIYLYDHIFGTGGDGYELYLGVPPVDGYVLSSTVAGVRSWVPIVTEYTLPKATTTTLGGVIVGDNLTIDADGVLSSFIPYIDTNTTQLISGTVIWLHDFVFQVSACTYYIMGVLYHSPATQITLDPSDTTNPRLDVIYVDITGSAGKITGVPEENAAKPIVEPTTQLELTSILVAANAVIPVEVTEELVYLENVEWVSSTVVTNNSIPITFNDTNLPKSGSVQTRVSKNISNQAPMPSFKYQKSGILFNALGSTLILSIRLSIPGTSNSAVIVTLKSYGTQVGNTVTIRNGTYGFSRYITTYQTVAIPFSAFNATDTYINTVQISFGGTQPSGVFKYDFDDVKFQLGTTPIIPTIYTLPTASATILGGIKVGNNLTIDVNGVLSATATPINPTPDILNWDSTKYTPYTTQGAGGTFDISTTYPLHFNRLNYDGILVASIFRTGDYSNFGRGSLSLGGEGTWYGNSPILRVTTSQNDKSIIESTSTRFVVDGYHNRTEPIYIGDILNRGISGYIAHNEWIRIDDFAQTFEINMTNITLSKGTANKWLSLDANKNIIYSNAPAQDFLHLTDVVATTYASKSGYVPMVTATENSLDLVATEELFSILATFTLLSDVPNNYVGKATQYVRVRGDELGLEFTTVSTTMTLPLGTVPLSSTAIGTAGTFVTDGIYMYYCIASGNWKRYQINNWT